MRAHAALHREPLKRGTFRSVADQQEIRRPSSGGQQREGLDEQVAEAEDLRSRLRDARWLDGEEALRETEQVAHEAVSALDRATSIRCSIGPALFRRIEAAGFEPGTMNPVSWLIAEVERLREEAHERTRLTTRQIVEEREQIVDLIEQHAGSVDDPRIAEELIKLTWMVEARAGSPPEAR